jgi:hypothetical protein
LLVHFCDRFRSLEHSPVAGPDRRYLAQRTTYPRRLRRPWSRAQKSSQAIKSERGWKLERGSGVCVLLSRTKALILIHVGTGTWYGTSHTTRTENLEPCCFVSYLLSTHMHTYHRPGIEGSSAFRASSSLGGSASLVRA